MVWGFSVKLREFLAQSTNWIYKKAEKIKKPMDKKVTPAGMPLD
jgi:hypothetical protein